MQLNLTDPDSILRWWRSFPERHWAYLEVFETCSPQFRGAIRQARRRIQADPLFDAARIEALARAQRAWPADNGDAPAPSQVITDDEIALH